MKTDRAKLGAVFREQIVRSDCYQVRPVIAECDVVLDIGANMGMFAIMSRILAPDARIISIEADPGTFKNLQFNTQFYDIECHNVALSETDFVQMHKGADSGSNSTAPASSGIKGLNFRNILKTYGLDPKKQNILLKVDCEGAERVIIEDSKSTRMLMDFAHVAMEMHYSNGRGARKWANAVSREDAEAWITELGFFPGHVVEYYHNRLGGMLVFKPVTEKT